RMSHCDEERRGAEKSKDIPMHRRTIVKIQEVGLLWQRFGFPKSGGQRWESFSPPAGRSRVSRASRFMRSAHSIWKRCVTLVSPLNWSLRLVESCYKEGLKTRFNQEEVLIPMHELTIL